MEAQVRGSEGQALLQLLGGWKNFDAKTELMTRFVDLVEPPAELHFHRCAGGVAWITENLDQD